MLGVDCDLVSVIMIMSLFQSSSLQVNHCMQRAEGCMHVEVSI